MIGKPDNRDIRKPRFLILDNTPLSLLGCFEALDWLFRPGCPVTITDMVAVEATRGPADDSDRRKSARAYISRWLETKSDKT